MGGRWVRLGRTMPVEPAARPNRGIPIRDLLPARPVPPGCDANVTAFAHAAGGVNVL